MLNNPLKYIDPNGMNVDPVEERDLDGQDDVVDKRKWYQKLFRWFLRDGSGGEEDSSIELFRSLTNGNDANPSSASFPRSAFRFQNITSNSQAAAIVDIPVNLYEKKGKVPFDKPSRYRTLRLTIEVTLPIKLSGIHDFREITRGYAAEKSAWAADQAMEWLAWKMAIDKSFGNKAWMVGGQDFIGKQLAIEMESYLNIDHEENGAFYPAIPGARVQSTLSGRISPSKVTGGDILIEYIRNIFGF